MKDTECRCKELEAKVAELQGRLDLDSEIIQNLLALKSSDFPPEFQSKMRELSRQLTSDHPPSVLSVWLQENFPGNVIPLRGLESVAPSESRRRSGKYSRPRGGRVTIPVREGEG